MEYTSTRGAAWPRHADARGDVAVQTEVCRSQRQPPADLRRHLVDRLAHRHPQRLRLVRSSNSAAIVVAQHDQRPVAQVGLEHQLAAGVEVAAIDQREHQRPARE